VVATLERDQMYQLGTAWAVSEQQLVTSASVILELEGLREKVPVVLARQPGSNVDLYVTGRVHPRYKRLWDHAKQLEDQLRQLESVSADLKEEGARKESRQKLDELDTLVGAAYQEAVLFDVGVLEVQGKLPRWLPRAERTDLKPGARVRLLGVPHSRTDVLVSPDDPPRVVQHAGKFLSRHPGFPADATAPLVFFCDGQLELSDQNWSGAPLLNAEGQVVGLYALPVRDPNAATNAASTKVHSHAAVDITVLRELIP
jgi:hypothetical protein